MSNINANAIDALYPIAGRDNNSQGFRNNFAAIKTALAVAADEVGDLETKSIVSAQLGNGVTTAVENNLNTSAIKNGIYSEFNPKYAPRGSSTSTTTIDLSNGPVQSFTVHDGDLFNFSWGNWPTEANPQPWPVDAPRRCVSVRLMFKTQTGTAQITFGGTVTNGSVSGTLVPESNVTLPLTVNSTSYTVFDAWTVDEGDFIYIHNVGVF